MLVHLSFVVENVDYNTVSIGNCAVITVYMDRVVFAKSP